MGRFDIHPFRPACTHACAEFWTLIILLVQCQRHWATWRIFNSCASRAKRAFVVLVVSPKNIDTTRAIVWECAIARYGCALGDVVVPVTHLFGSFVVL